MVRVFPPIMVEMAVITDWDAKSMPGVILHTLYGVRH